MIIKSAKSIRLLIAAALLGAIPHTLTAQIVAGKVNNFEDGTTQGWAINLLGNASLPAAALPVNVSTGGPAGVDDNYLRLTSLGFSLDGGGRLTAANGDWSGNWLAAGITSVRFNAINLGASDLTLRLLMEDPAMAPPTNIAASATGRTLLAGSGWQTLEFDLFGADGLAPLLGSVNQALTNTTLFRIFHSTAFAFPGEPITAQLGVDNITAVAAVTTVPEPSTIVLFGAGAIGLLLLRRRAAR